MALYIEDKLPAFDFCQGRGSIQRALLTDIKKPAALVVIGIGLIKSQQGTGSTAAGNKKLTPGLTTASGVFAG